MCGIVGAFELKTDSLEMRTQVLDKGQTGQEFTSQKKPF